MRSRRYFDLVLRVLNTPNYWLLAIALGLITLHLQLTWRFVGNVEQISLDIIGWTGLLFCLWQRRGTILLRSDPLSRSLGWFLLGLILIRSFNLQTSSSILLNFTTLAIGLAIALITVGWRQLKCYQRELWIVAAIAFPISSLGPLIERFIDVNTLTAKYAHVLMWYSGFVVQRNGVQLVMPTGAVEVFSPCSGLDAALISLKVAIFFLLVFPTNWKEKLLVPTIAVVSAFFVNGFRIMLMAHLVASKNMEAFNYWHTGDGSQVFAMISMTLFSSYCQFLIDRRQAALVESSETAAASEATEEELERSSF